MSNSVVTERLIARVQSLMLERKLTQHECALQCDIPQPTLNRILNRRVVPGLATVEKVCNGLGIELKDLLNDPE
jgi:transcriptional regulator with XRE-family HTH domain